MPTTVPEAKDAKPADLSRLPFPPFDIYHDSKQDQAKKADPGPDLLAFDALHDRMKRPLLSPRRPATANTHRPLPPIAHFLEVVGELYDFLEERERPKVATSGLKPDFDFSAHLWNLAERVRGEPNRVTLEAGCEAGPVASPGHVAYQAYLGELDGISPVTGEGLVAWCSLNEEMRQGWESAAQAVIRR
jgi:hypothetical protein